MIDADVPLRLFATAVAPNDSSNVVRISTNLPGVIGEEPQVELAVGCADDPYCSLPATVAQ